MNRRPYAGPEDLPRLQEFTAAVIREHGRTGMLHPGDVPHHIYNGLRHDDPHELVHIWEDGAGAIAGWALLDPRRDGLDVQFNHGLRNSHPDLEREILLWSQQRLLELIAARGAEVEAIETDASVPDAERIALLESLGWVEQEGEEILVLTRRAIGEVAPVELPVGYRTRTVRGIEEAGPVAELHGACFGSSWTTELYERVMTSPGYSADRELLIEAPGGELAGFSVLWPDHMNRIGLFEPVGVHPDHRRLGLGRVLMRAGLEMMREWGMESAEVLYAEENPGSGSLYRSEGFVPIEKIILFRMAVS